jgi:predicted O-methyltransferase YrrM
VSQRTWDAVDAYVEDRLLEPDAVLQQALADANAAGLPPIAVTPSQGKQLHLLARSIGARRILEIGTLGGYSTIWLARALPPDGLLVTLEREARYADVAAANIQRAGLSAIVDLKVGAALQTLPLLAAERPPPFDLVFIDADKAHTPDYFTWAVQLTRPGAWIVADNVIRDGALVDPEVHTPDVLGNRRLHEIIAGDAAIAARVSATTIQTVGAKGYDGYLLALVLEPDRARG